GGAERAAGPGRAADPAASTPARPAGRPGDDLPEMPRAGSLAALSIGRGLARGPAPLPRRPAHPGPADPRLGPTRPLGQAAAEPGRPGGPGARRRGRRGRPDRPPRASARVQEPRADAGQRPAPESRRSARRRQYGAEIDARSTLDHRAEG